MRWKNYIDADEVRRAIQILHRPGAVFEVRIIGKSSTGRKEIFSGYFRDAETMLQEVDAIDIRNKILYITLGEVKEECFSRSQSEHFERDPNTTSDNEITSYQWLFVDFDPVRPTGISSSDAELKEAEALRDKVLLYMTGLGFKDPVKAMSGNGYHLLYPIDIPNDQPSRLLIEKCLKNLSSMFDTEKVKIDTTNSNPSRICKLYGTLAQKGRNTKERPHRMSRILSVPKDIKTINGREILQKLADELPDEQPKQTNFRRGYKSNAEEFDLLSFLSRNGIRYKEQSGDRSKIYRLEECPFDRSHKDGDAKIFQYPDGAIAFKCHHNSCREYRWQDVRLKFEPDAYTKHEEDDARIDAGYKAHKHKVEEENAIRAEVEKDTKKEKPKPQPKVFRKLKTADDLMQKDIPEPRVYIGVGEEIPLLAEGTCILSAKPKLGKSWLALAMCIALSRGDDFLGYKTRHCSTLYLDLETSESLQQKRLRKMLKGEDPPKNFYLDTETDNIENGFIDQIEDYMKQDPGIGLVIIDVFQLVRTKASSNKETEYEHAYRDIKPLNEVAQKHHISIVLVCHDRKSVDPDDPFSNILGSTGLQGAATQMIVMFKKKKDDPIHISIKGKTIDGLPELDVKLENAEWSLVDSAGDAEREKERLAQEYLKSDIRRAVVAIAENEDEWKGRCSEIIQEAILNNVPLTETPKNIGKFLHMHQARFLAEDDVQVLFIGNGTGPTIYKISKSTIDTIDENEELPLMDFKKLDRTSPF